MSENSSPDEELKTPSAEPVPEERDGADISSENIPRSEASSGPASEPPKESPSEPTLEELRSMYGKKSSSFGSKYRLASSIVALSALLLMLILIVSGYAYSLTVIGNRTYAGKTYHIFGFISHEVSEMKRLIDGMSSGGMEVLGYFGFVQSVIRIVCASAVLLVGTIYAILSVVRFARKKDTVPCAVAGLMRWVLILCAILSLIGNTTGGEGEAFFLIGYGFGKEMIAGLAIGAAALIACTVLSALEGNRTKEMMTEIGQAVLCSALFCVMTTLPMYSVFSYVITYSITTVVASIGTSSFSFSGLGFPVLNLLLLIFTMTILQQSGFAAERGWKRLTCESFRKKDDEGQVGKDIVKRSGKKKKRLQIGPAIPSAVLAVLNVVWIVLLRVPSIGLGWSVELLPKCIAVAVLAALWMTMWLLERRKPSPKPPKTTKTTSDPSLTKKTEATSETASTAVSKATSETISEPE